MDDQVTSWPPGHSAANGVIRAMDWSNSLLGPVETWPPSLRIAVSNALESPVGTIVLWGTDLIQFYNDSYHRIQGVRHPLEMGQVTRECWPEPWHFNRLIYAEVVATGATLHYDKQESAEVSSNDRKTFHFTVTYSPLRDETGQIHGVIVRIIDTTKRIVLVQENERLAEIAAVASERQSFNLILADALRSLVEPDDVIAKASGLLGERLGACRVLYCEVDDANGTFEIRRDWTRPGVASVAGQTRYLSEFGDELISTLRSGNALAVGDLTREARAVNVLEGYASLGIKAFLAIPLLQNGELSVVLVVHQTKPYSWNEAEVQLAQDFIGRTWAAAENAKVQAVLRMERDRSQAVFDCMKEGFGLINREGIVLQMNNEGLRIAQREACDVIGRNHWEIWPETKDTPLAHLYAKVIDTGIAGSIEYEHTFWNGVKSWLEIRAYRTPSFGLALFYRDIGDRKFVQTALIEADHRKDEFLAMLAHELRNPLSPISAAASLLLLGRHDEKLIKRASEIISRQVSHMSSLIDDLLDVARVTRGIIDFHKTTLDAKTIVAEAVEQVQPLIESHQHRLLVSLSPKTTFILGDKKRLVQILTNLLNNAAKYTPDRGEIFISTEIREYDVAISVRDTGIGMAPELLTRAFQLFAQESRTPDRSQGGLGLGLSLVKSLVELHEGTVTARSAGLGHGSEFTVLLPRMAAPVECSIQDAASHGDTVKSPLKILVVDDNADSANTFAMLLTTLGHSVSVVFTGVDALERARAERFDVCLLDIGLPDLDGHELGKQIRTDSKSMHATLIAVTGYGQKQDELDSAAAGFHHHLVKPVNVATLIKLLEEAGTIRGSVALANVCGPVE